MRHKTLLLATTAVVLLAGAGQAQAEDLYISVLGGTNWQSDTSGAQTDTTTRLTTITSFSEDADTGFVLGGAIGTHLDKWVQGLRAEMEVAYRRNDHNGAWVNVVFDETDTGIDVIEGIAGPLSANASNFSVMANVWYDIEMGWKAKPYLGAGVGWARSRLDGTAASTTTTNCCTLLDGAVSFRQENSGFAWQLGAGFNYEVSPGVNVGLGYRYFRGPSFDPIFIGKNFTQVSIENDNQSVTANLSIAIN